MCVCVIPEVTPVFPLRCTVVAAATTLTSVVMMSRESPQRKALKGQIKDYVVT